MATAVVRVVHPTEREDGSAIVPTEVKSWRVEYKPTPASQWSQLGGARLPSETQANVANLTTGEYEFRAYWLDTDDQESAPASTTYTVGKPALLKPGAINVLPS